MSIIEALSFILLKYLPFCVIVIGIGLLIIYGSAYLGFSLPARYVAIICAIIMAARLVKVFAAGPSRRD